MRKLRRLLILIVAGFLQSDQPARCAGSSESDPAFADLSNEFIEGYLAWRPQTATALGLHEYDGKVTDFSRGSLDTELARLKKFDQRLAALETKPLGPQARYDLRILQAAIKNELFQFEDLASHTQNPMTYAGVIDVNIYIKRDFAPLEDRLKSIIAIEKQTPRIMAAARANLDESLPKPFIETAIEIASGAADFLGKDLVDAVKGITNESLKKEFQAANRESVDQLRGYGDWLKNDKLPKAHQHYALGRGKYEKMLRQGELIEAPSERILEIGLKELRHEQQAFAAAANRIDPARKPIDVFTSIQKHHPTEESFLPDVRRNLEAIRQFVVGHKIVTIPSAVRAAIEETPQYLRATSFASMDTPGPFETKATEAYYYVTPVEKDWMPQQKEEWLTAFNTYTTDIVTIHEAYPGHYVQFLCLNASPATRLEKIFTSYAFTEGWAHYAEQMLIDEGFGASGDQPAAAAMYRLAQSDEALLRLCRLCVSVKTHCEGMTLEDATRFFEDNCYYEHKPAYQEALRGTFDPGYLYYTVGKLEILKLRSDWQKQEGANYSLQKFHDELLRHGSPPIRLLRELMLKDKAAWNDIL